MFYIFFLVCTLLHVFIVCFFFVFIWGSSTNQLYICTLPSAACVDATLVHSKKAIYLSVICFIYQLYDSRLTLSLPFCVTQIMSKSSNVLQLVSKQSVAKSNMFPVCSHPNLIRNQSLGTWLRSFEMTFSTGLCMLVMATLFMWHHCQAVSPLSVLLLSNPDLE